MSGLKYIRFRDLVQLDPGKKTELLNSISLLLSPTKALIMSTQNLVSIQHHDPILTSKSVVIVSSPPSNDIQQWFAEHRLSDQLRDLFDFQSREEMLDYAEVLLSNRDQQMEIYEKVYRQKYQGQQLAPHEFLRFSKALEQLLKEHRAERQMPVKAKPDPSNQSQVCVIS